MTNRRRKLWNRIVSLLLVFVMVFTMLPTTGLADMTSEEAQELYLQMLDLGLVDADGSLIEETRFVREDNSVLAENLTELRTILADESTDLTQVVQVWGIGGTATLDQLRIALGIEDQMAELAAGMNALASGDGEQPPMTKEEGEGADDELLQPADTMALAAAADSGLDIDGMIYDHRLTFTTSTQVKDNGKYLVVYLTLSDVPAHDVTVDVGVFAPFLENTDDLTATTGEGEEVTTLGEVAGINGYHTIVFSSGIGESGTEVTKEVYIDMEKMASLLKERQPGHLDGNYTAVVQIQNIEGAYSAREGYTFSFSFAHSKDNTVPETEYKGWYDANGEKMDYHIIRDVDEHIREIEGTEEEYRADVHLGEIPSWESWSSITTVQKKLLKHAPTLISLGMGDASPKVILDDFAIFRYDKSDDKYDGYSVWMSYEWQDEYITWPNANKRTAIKTVKPDGAGGDDPNIVQAYMFLWNFYYTITQKTEDTYEEASSKASEQAMRGSVIYARDLVLPLDLSAKNSKYVIPVDFRFETVNLIKDWLNDDDDASIWFVMRSFNFYDSTAPTIQGISWPQDTQFYPGQSIPITVTFNEPVLGEYELVLHTADGDVYLKQDNGAMVAGTVVNENDLLSNTRVFLYEVQDIDSTKISVKGVRATRGKIVNTMKPDGCVDWFDNEFDNGDLGYQTITDDGTAVAVAEGQIVSALVERSLKSVRVKDSEGNPITTIGNTRAQRIVTIEVELDAAYKQDWADWNNAQQQGADLPFTAYAVLDGNEEEPVALTLYEENGGLYLRGTMTMPPVYEDTRHIVEISLNGERILGPDLYHEATQQAIVKVGQRRYGLAVFNIREEPVNIHFLNNNEWPSGKRGLIYQLDDTLLQLGRTPTTHDPLATKGTYENEEDFVILIHSYPEDLSLIQDIHALPQDDSVVKLDPNGYLQPVAPGQVVIVLWATNGSDNIYDYTFQASEIVIVEAGNKPGILIPRNANTFVGRAGEDLEIPFSTNLRSMAPEGDPITVELKEMTTGGADGTVVYTGTIDRIANLATVPGQHLTQMSQGDQPAYTVTLRTTVDFDDDGSIADNGSETIETTAYVIVRSQPASVTLTGLDQTSHPAGTQLQIGWDLGNLDPYHDNSFEFLVTREGGEVYKTTQIQKATSTTASGSYTLTLQPPSGNELRTSYIVTAKAKNYADPTWTTDSRVIHVYRDGSLEILVEGQDPGSQITLHNEVTENQTTTDPTITNLSGQEFADLSNAYAIAQLRSQLGLVRSLTIDTSTYHWSDLDDMIEWVYDNPDVVTVNYRRGSIYEPLENFSYSAYMPGTLLALCGEDDGSGVITATHSQIDGLTDSVAVNVERLEEKLYLFQFSPAVTTTVSYFDSKGVEHVVTSNADGSLALYEPDGIGNDNDPYLWAVSNSGGVTYMGGWSIYNIYSGEGVGTMGDLYPMNSLSLRRAAYASMTLVKPDGTPYAGGELTLRGGVYRNGEYCADARFSNTTTTTPNDNGTVDSIYKTDKYGVLHVYMATDQFMTESQTDRVDSKDVLQFIFELRFGTEENGYTDYFPVLHTVDASLNDLDMTRLGEHIITLEEVPNDKQQVFVAAQKVDYHIGRQIDCLTHTGVIGPSFHYPEIELHSYVMLWGQQDTEAEGYELILRDMYGIKATEQTDYSVVESTYPFSSIPLVKNVAVFNDENLWFDGGKENRRLELKLERNDALLNTMALPFGLVNVLRIGKVEASQELLSLMANIAAYGTLDGANTSSELVNKTSDHFLMPGVEFLSKMGSTIGTVRTILVPTADPTRYKGYFWSGLNTMSLEDIPYDANGVFVEGTFGEIEVADTFGISDFQAMADGSFFDETSNITSSVSNALGIPIVARMEGWVTSEVRYNYDKMEWDVVTTGGGFTAGAGLLYEKSFNVKPAGIPLTATFKVKGDLVVDFKMAVRYAEQLGMEWNDKNAKAVNDYLTALRIRAYFEAFGGLGHDKGFTLKIGAFGIIEIDNENRFLTRNYLKDTSKRDLRGQYLKLTGEAGLRVEAGVGPAVIAVTLAAVGAGSDWTFNDWEEMSRYWKYAVSDPGGTGMLTPTLQKDLDGMMLVEESMTMDTRQYLLSNTRTWDGGGLMMASRSMSDSLLAAPSTLYTLTTDRMLASLQTNAYPNSQPMLTEDGGMLAYLSDADSTDVTDTEVRYSVAAGDGSFPDGTAIDDPGTSAVLEGHGDSSLALDGNSSFAGAVWLRQTENLGLAAGEELDEGQLALILNSMEVVAALWNGSSWSAARITDNGSQDMLPVIAVSKDAAGNDQAIVVWRTVETDMADILTLTDERLLYKVYRDHDGDGTAEWSADTYTLYNGSGGMIKGLDVELLADGTAAIAYSLDTGSQGTIEDYEIYYALTNIHSVDGNGLPNHEDTARTIRITADAYLDEAPQLTTTSVWDEMAQAYVEHFVLAWHSYQAASGVDVHDLRMIVFGADGTPRTDFPGSLSDLVGTESFNGQFALADGADTLEQLSVVYTDAGTGTAGADVLRGVKFSKYNNRYIPSASIELAEMPVGGTADWYDAYVADAEGMELGAVLQASVPTGEMVQTDIYDVQGNVIGQLAAPVTVSQMHTARAEYANDFTVDAITVDYTTLAADSYIPVVFTITNQGTLPMEQVTVELGSSDPVEQIVDLAGLMPGSSKTVSAIWKTGGTIENVFYEILDTTTYPGSVQGGSQTGTVYLDYPDVGISGLNVTQEYDGLRKLYVNLYDQAAADLYQPDRRVVIGVYANSAYDSQMDGLYFGGTAGEGYQVILTEEEALEAIDHGYHGIPITFDAESYVKNLGYDEIPEGRIPLFIQVQVEERQSDGSWVTLPEANMTNNQTVYYVESLLYRNGEEITLSTDVEAVVTAATATAEEGIAPAANTNNAAGTKATVIVQNNSMQSRNGGNVIATLLDGDGKVLETQQTYDGTDASLLALGAEERIQLTFAFAQTGASVRVVYGDADLQDPTNTRLATAKMEGAVLTKDSFDAEGKAVVNGVAVGEHLLSVVPEDVRAAVSVDGKPVTGGNIPISFDGISQTITFVVTAADGTTTQEYRLTLHQMKDGTPISRIHVEQSSGGEISMDANRGRSGGEIVMNADGGKAGDIIIVTLKPNRDHVARELHVTDANGIAVATSYEGDGIYTFVMPESAVKITASFRYDPCGANGHNWDQGKCTVCGTQIAQNAENAPTGDLNDPMKWVWLAGIALIILAGWEINREKQQ